MDVALSPYIAHLSGLPFVRDVQIVLSASGHPAPRGDALRELSTPTSKHRLHVEEKRTHLTRAMTDHIIAQSAKVPDIRAFQGGLSVPLR